MALDIFSRKLIKKQNIPVLLTCLFHWLLPRSPLHYHDLKCSKKISTGLLEADNLLRRIVKQIILQGLPRYKQDAQIRLQLLSCGRMKPHSRKTQMNAFGQFFFPWCCLLCCTKWLQLLSPWIRSKEVKAIGITSLCWNLLIDISPTKTFDGFLVMHSVVSGSERVRLNVSFFHFITWIHRLFNRVQVMVERLIRRSIFQV